MAEFRPGLCTEAAQQGLMQWLLKRIKVRQNLTECVDLIRPECNFSYFVLFCEFADAFVFVV